MEGPRKIQTPETGRHAAAERGESKAPAGLRPTLRNARFAGTCAIVLAAAEVALDLATWVELDIASIYGISLVLAAFARSRRLLWTLMVALTAATFVTYALQIPAGVFHLRDGLFVNRVLDAVSLLIIAGLVHVQIAARDVREAQSRLLAEQNRRLEAGNELLLAHESQIVAQNEELARRRQEAEEASGRKTRVLHAVSHDIRNPVNTISLMAEVIRHTAEDPALATQVPQLARRLQSSAQSLLALVSEVLDIGYLDSGRLQRHDTMFSLNEFIAAKHRDLAALAEAKSLQLIAEVPQTAVRLCTDRVKLDRIVTNLVTNAVKFTERGRVTLSATLAAGSGAAICVRDTGVGIPQHELGRIFEEFAQVDAPTGASNKGWGLGLAISRRLAAFIGARISVESEPGRGTAFTVALPPDAVMDIAPVELPVGT
jgi:signal transduction histidine kinase